MNKEKLMEKWDELKDKTKAQILQLADAEIKKYYFIPNLGDVYYTYNIGGVDDISAFARSFFDTDLDNMFITVGNCFKTAEEAIFFGKCEYYTKQFEAYVDGHSEPLDWEDKEQKKYFIYCSGFLDIIKFDFANRFRGQGTTYASSEQVLKNAVEDIGEEKVRHYVMRAGAIHYGKNIYLD